MAAQAGLLACMGTQCGWQSHFSESQRGVGFAEGEGCSEGPLEAAHS